MKRKIFPAAMLFSILFATTGQAQNKVVVVPLAGDDPEPLRWAKVSFDGTTATLMNGSGVTSVAKFDDEEVLVTFSTSVSDCGWVATRNALENFPQKFGEISVIYDSLQPNDVVVHLGASNGSGDSNEVFDAFTIHVLC